jgi:hypothetical protein
MTKYIASIAVILIFASTSGICGSNPDSTGNTRQYYSGMVGFYAPSDGLNNGLLLGVDGITEFKHYNFFLSLALDAYFKQTFSIFDNPQPGGGQPPDVSQQQMILLPIHLNYGYKLAEVADADTRVYAGAGVGYYLYFYSATYAASSSGSLLGGVGSSQSSDSKSGGALFASIFARVVINKIFVEPRYYFAAKSNDALGGYAYTVNPTGFAITLGVQYH